MSKSVRTLQVYLLTIAYSFPTSDGTSGQVLKTDGSGSLSFGDQPSSGITIFTYSISSTTTSITGSDDNSNTLSYTSGSEQVYINGVKLVSGSDYTATNSSTITLTENALSGDTVEVVAITAFSNLVQGFLCEHIHCNNVRPSTII